MKLPSIVDSFDALKVLDVPLHLAIGVFDGVHLGHKAVIEPAVLSSQKLGGVSAVLTFDPHPSRLFRQEDPTRLILPISVKAFMLQSIGVDIVIRKHFDRAYASTPAADFLIDLKIALPTLAAVYVGSNFRFGENRAGNVQTLIESGQLLGLDIFGVDRIHYDGAPISSTRIRKELEQGSMTTVNSLLGYNYCTMGSVINGEGLGSRIGFPTLNLDWKPECEPRHGVYCVRFHSMDSETWIYGVANYGVRPTVADSESPLLEVHALKGTEVEAGEIIIVEWLNFLRAEQKFSSLKALSKQIASDCAKARIYAKND